MKDKQFLQQNLLVCFCDIKPDENTFHRQCYGSFSLALSKQWGIRNKVSPVRYVHSNSPGLEQELIELRNFTRGLFKYEHTFEGLVNSRDRIVRNILAWSFWMDNRNVSDEIVEVQVNKQFDALIEIIKSEKKEDVLKDFIIVLRKRIVDLHHALEIADPFLRSYKEDFICPNSGHTIKDKILYDEREWRSCITTCFPEDMIVSEESNGIVMKGYLGDKYNLRFTDEDLVEIRLDKAKLKNELLDFLNGNALHLDTDLTMDKVRINE